MRRSAPRVVLGCDVGTSFGWAVLRRGDTLLRSGDAVHRVGSGRWRLPGGGSERGKMDRLVHLRTHLDDLLVRAAVEVVAYEKVEHHVSTWSAQVYGELVGVLRLACADADLPPPVGLGVGAVKKRLTGRGNAKKDLMVASARPILGRDPVSDDEADALGVALAWLDQPPPEPLSVSRAKR